MRRRPPEKEAARWVLAPREGRSSAPKVSIRHEGETELISLTQGNPSQRASLSWTRWDSAKRTFSIGTALHLPTTDHATR
jgi:hypothetical protein